MATEYSTTLLLPQAPLMAPPVDPSGDPNERAEQDRERQADCPELLDYLKRTCESVRKQREGDWQRILDSQARCVAYYDNRQVGTVKDGVFIDAQRRPGDFIVIDNQYKIQVDKLLMEMCRAFSDIKVNAVDRNDTRMVEAAKFAHARMKANRKKLLKYSFRISESLALLLKTISFRYTYYKHDAEDAPPERRAKKGLKKLGQGLSVASCKLCGGPMKEGVCLKCGSARAGTLESGSTEQEVVEGYEESPGGYVCSEHVDPTMVRISLSARNNVSDSPFLWYHQRVDRCRLEEAFPDAKIKNVGGQMSSSDRYKMDAEGSPSNAPESEWLNSSDADVRAGGDQFEECPLDLFWLDPVVYRKKKFKRPQRLKDGRTLPADTEMGSFWEQGMCVAMNTDQVLGEYEENKNKKWSFCVYGKREHALHGSGTNALLGPQDTRNDLKSYLIADTYYNTGRREFIRNGSFTGNRLPAINEVAIINDVPEERPVKGWAYHSETGNALPRQVQELYQSEAGALQEGAGTSSLSSEGAAQDLKAAMGTATGIAAMRDQAVGRMGPNLMLQTEMEEEWGYVVLELELENFTPERYLRMANQSVTAEDVDGSVTYSAEGIKAFMECNPRRDLEIETVPGSWMPRTEQERVSKFNAFTQVAVDIATKMAGDSRAPELIALAADVYGVTEIDLGGWTSSEHVAAARIRALAKTCETFERRGRGQPAPEIVLEVIAATPDAMVDMEMDNHALFRAFYKEWWSSDEARPESCSPLLRAVIKAEEMLHRDGLIYTAQEVAKDKLKADEPQMQAAQQMAQNAKQTAMQDEPPKELLSYKDAPPSIKRQMEAAAGYQPDQGEQTADTSVEEAKTQGKMVENEQKTQLDMKKAEHQSQLKMTEQEQAAELKRQELELQHAHQAGIKAAEIAHQAATGDQKLQHEKEMSENDRRIERERMIREQASAAREKQKK